MKPRSIIPRIGKTLISIGFGLILVCGALLFSDMAQPANAAPLFPHHSLPALASRAVVTVTTTIQDAIDAASPGDMVEFTGAYTEEVVINKPLTLRGTSPAATIIYDGAAFPSAPTIHITADEVSIANLSLKAVGPIVNHSAIWVENSSKVWITNVMIQNYPTGIRVERSIAGPTGITIINNTIRGPVGPGQGGIYLLGSGPGVGPIQAGIQSNQISGYNLPPLINAVGLAPSLIAGNTLNTPGSPNAVIYLDQNGSSLVQNNILATSKTSQIGIRLTGSANPTVIRNIVSSQFARGIQVDEAATPLIVNSIVSGHTFGISIIDTAAPTVVNNTISKNKFYGIDVQGAATPVISGNILSGNVFFGVNIVGNSQPQIINNIVTGGMGTFRVVDPARPTIVDNWLIDSELETFPVIRSHSS